MLTLTFSLAEKEAFIVDAEGNLVAKLTVVQRQPLKIGFENDSGFTFWRGGIWRKKMAEKAASEDHPSCVLRQEKLGLFKKKKQDED